MPDASINEPASGADSNSSALAELRRRMGMPQRHRLLHGYPQAAAMQRRHGLAEFPIRDVEFGPTRDRGLLVGVLPHPFCNPALAGCGFCTFPHEVFNTRKSEEVVSAVIREIQGRVRRFSKLRGRSVTALYFGGGTANLTPAEPFRLLCRTLAKHFDLSMAEVTLEGVPSYFLNRQPLLIDIMREEIPARHFRISMGIQTFDVNMLERMGRQGFGSPATFRSVVELGHSRGFTVSADLLFNLPGQSLDEMKADVEKVIEIDVDHLGLYHLVMFDGLGTPWSKDSELLASLPTNQRGCENWLALRSLVLDRGFTQTTLTNFEKNELRGGRQRFLYEECSFQPLEYDMIGFGPSAISFSTYPGPKGGSYRVKIVNPDSSEDYIGAVAKTPTVWNRWFIYGPRDLQIVYLTRRLAALNIERSAYRTLFDSDPLDDFPSECEAMTTESLVEIDNARIRPTPRGMFYADSIAVLWAWKRVQNKRAHALNESRVSSMG